MGGGQLDHLARADEQDADLAQVLEQIARQPHGGGHADAVRADFGGTAHFLGHGKAALEELVQRLAQGTGLLGGTHGVLHLAQDLRFPQHHGIQPACHPESVARGFVALQHVGVAAQFLGEMPPLCASHCKVGAMSVASLAQ